MVSEGARHIRSSGSASDGQASPVDRAHLARYTRGDQAFEREVLELFCTQAVSYLDQLCAAASHKAWFEAAHALKGSARSVGAWRLVRAAEYIETLRADSPPELRAAQIRELEASLQEAATFVASLSNTNRK